MYILSPTNKRTINKRRRCESAPLEWNHNFPMPYVTKDLWCHLFAIGTYTSADSRIGPKSSFIINFPVSFQRSKDLTLSSHQVILLHKLKQLVHQNLISMGTVRYSVSIRLSFSKFICRQWICSSFPWIFDRDCRAQRRDVLRSQVTWIWMIV